ncbi:hypothetical protein [Algivirga pacifica]|uniref:2'-5' RNA ligase superfamily protein n=1 Tax=Algivirga pacifica TaxID=1162670 RepID=A0ABP9D7X7_9BACT
MIKAVDLVIVPDEILFQRSLEANRSLVSPGIELGKRHTIPHISLCMAMIEESNIPVACEEIKGALSGIKIDTLTIEKIYQHGINTVGWTFKKDSWLIHLQQTVETILKKYHVPVAPQAFDCFANLKYGDPAGALLYVNQFFEQYGGSQYEPHITLGRGELSPVHHHIGDTFEGGKIALYHLGSSCTCEKLLENF